MNTLATRKTSKYVGEYKHLDEWEPIGTIREAASKIIRRNDKGDDGDPSDGPTYETFVEITLENKDLPEETVKQAIYDYFRSWGCACEHDCCGCTYTSVNDVKKLGDGYYRVITTDTRNY